MGNCALGTKDVCPNCLYFDDIDRNDTQERLTDFTSDFFINIICII